jgi:hypothetical protein
MARRRRTAPARVDSHGDARATTRPTRGRATRTYTRGTPRDAPTRSNAMSVVGIDFGNVNNVVALARRKGIDVVLNDESKRETPSMINYGEKQVRRGERMRRRCEDGRDGRAREDAIDGRRARTTR